MDANQFNFLLSENIRYEAKKRGYKLYELAEVIGISSATLSQKLKGITHLNPFDIKKIADEFLMSVDELMTTEGVF